MKKRVIALIAIVCLLFTGCWNYREINQLSIIAGLAIDIDDKTKDYVINFEVVDFRGAGSSGSMESERIESRGRTLFECTRNAISLSGTRLYWGQIKVVIVSQEVAQLGLHPALDFIFRIHEARISADVFVAKTIKAKEILFAQSILSDIRSYEISRMAEQVEHNSSVATRVHLYEFIQQYSSEGITPVLPSIQIIKNADKPELNPSISGVAIFKEDKFVGFVNSIDSKVISTIRNKFKSGLFTLKVTDTPPSDNITLEIMKVKTKLKPEVSGDQVTMNIQVNMTATINEENTYKDFTTKEGFLKLEQIVEKEIETRTLESMNKIIFTYGVDPYGFGQVVCKSHATYWKEHYKEWYKIIKTMPIKIKAHVDLNGSGLAQKPMKVGD